MNCRKDNFNSTINISESYFWQESMRRILRRRRSQRRLPRFQSVRVWTVEPWNPVH